jgi:hypothetical protein
MGVKVTITMPNGNVIDPLPTFGQFADSWHGSNHLTGYMISFPPNWASDLGGVLGLIGMLLFAFETAGIGVAVIGAVLWYASWFNANSGWTYMYFDIVWWTWWIFSGCLYSEVGFQTDHIHVPFVADYNLGQMYYVPVWNSVIMDVVVDYALAGDLQYAHTGVWPNGF